MEIYKKNLS